MPCILRSVNTKKETRKKSLEKCDNKKGEGKERNKKSQENLHQGKGDNDKNKCQLPDHNHNWSKRPNIPKSTNYREVSYKVFLKDKKEKIKKNKRK